MHRTLPHSPKYPKTCTISSLIINDTNIVCGTNVTAYPWLTKDITQMFICIYCGGRETGKLGGQRRTLFIIHDKLNKAGNRLSSCARGLSLRNEDFMRMRIPADHSSHRPNPKVKWAQNNWLNLIHRVCATSPQSANDQWITQDIIKLRESNMQNAINHSGHYGHCESGPHQDTKWGIYRLHGRGWERMCTTHLQRSELGVRGHAG